MIYPYSGYETIPRDRLPLIIYQGFKVEDSRLVVWNLYFFSLKSYIQIVKSEIKIQDHILENIGSYYSLRKCQKAGKKKFRP